MYFPRALTVLAAVLSYSGVHAAAEESMEAFALPDGYTGSLTINREALAKCAKVDLPTVGSKPVPQNFVVKGGEDDCANPLNVTSPECGVQGTICIKDGDKGAEKALGGGTHVEDINWCKFNCSMSCMFLIILPPMYATPPTQLRRFLLASSLASKLKRRSSSGEGWELPNTV
ncbi:hypothetical protein F4809DRAFT_636980 [Biscogniauxia mediterranea]|nr:hypothetical protein F4809DRAFT_636980 [Biscogniauxia mediterranea]